MPLNIKIYKEFLILIAGPFFQVLAYLTLSYIMPKEKELIEAYHYGILLFNLLPIYPLDGGKIINLLLSLFFPYKNSLKICIYISYLISIIILLSQDNFKLNIVIMTIFTIFLITKEKNKINQLFQKFILERYLNTYNFKSSKIVTNINSFYRNKKHLIYENNKYYWEKDYLVKKYKKKQ